MKGSAQVVVDLLALSTESHVLEHEDEALKNQTFPFCIIFSAGNSQHLFWPWLISLSLMSFMSVAVVFSCSDFSDHGHD